MRRTSITLGVAGVLLVSCGSDGGSGNSSSDDNGDSDTSTHVGPVSFKLPDGLQEVYRDAEREGGWVAEFADDDESAGAFIGVWRFRETPPSASDAATEMTVQVRASGTHPGIRTGEGGEGEIPGAEDASVVDFSLEDAAEDITGRWWVLVDQNQDVAATVEFYGSEVSEEDLDRFGGSLEMDAGQSW